MKKINVVLIFVFIFGLLLDQSSKYVIESNMELFESISVIPNFFSITYVHNTGAAFSMLEGKIIFFYIVTIVALIILVMFYRSLKEYQWMQKIGVMMMMSGTIGNLIDRIQFQYVRDFLDFIIFGYDFAIFNVADSFLVVGIIIVIVDELMEEFGVKYGKNIQGK